MSRTVYFVSDIDNTVLTADYDDISLSPVVLGFIEDTEDYSENPIPISESAEVISAVLQFCKMYRQNPVLELLEGYKSYKKKLEDVLPAEYNKFISDIESKRIPLKVLMCAHFLNIHPLTEIMSARIAYVVRPDLDKRPSEVKESFVKYGYCA